MRRALLVCLLALLLSMQHEVYVHAFSHFAPFAGQAHDTGFASMLADAECPRCALLAAGSNAVPAQTQSTFVAALADESEGAVFRSRAVAAPAFFSSRAPPVLS
jgi:hypothetical protein